MALKAVKLIARGRVQRIGLRRSVLDSAQSPGISGYVKNEPDGSVTIFARGEGEKLSSFIESVSEAREPAFTRELERVETDVKSGLRYYRTRFGKFGDELLEGFGAMEVQFGDYRNEFGNYRNELNEFSDYRNEFRDYRGEFRGFASRTDGNFRILNEEYGEIPAKLTQMLDTLQKRGEAFQREMAETRGDMTTAVDNLSRLVDEYISLVPGTGKGAGTN